MPDTLVVPGSFRGGDLPIGVGDPVAVDEVPFWLLAAMAASYQQARGRTVLATQQAAKDLWLKLRPVTDADMTRWLEAFDTLLAASAAQQTALTQGYVSASLNRFGVSRYVTPDVVPSSVVNTEKVAGWLDGPVGAVAPDSLIRKVETVLDHADKGILTVADTAVVDRLPWMSSPVIDMRSRLGAGEPVVKAVQSVVPRVEGFADTHLREVESVTRGAAAWPSFKSTGSAMMYARMPQAGACGWCRAVATRLYSLRSYKSSKTGAWHAYCHCTWAPVTLKQAETYSQRLAKDGDYYAAAESVGLWKGPRPDSWQELVAERAVPVAERVTP